MAKIDVTNIPGYEAMSDADKLKALLNYSIPEPDMKGYVRKETFDATASELSALKKEKRASMDEADRVAAETADKMAEMQKRIDELTERETTASYKANFLALGYDDKLASETATALAKGDIAKFFANQTAFITAHDKAKKAELMGGMTPPPAGKEGAPQMTLDALKKLSIADRAKYASEHPDEYKSMYEGGTT